MDLGPHAAFIWSAYGVSAVVIAALIFRAVLEERKQRRVLVRLEQQGVRRRSETGRSDHRGA
jgi:heme exporter protein D